MRSPELGDLVYNVMGVPIGPITFFYDRVNDTCWRVQVRDAAEDPLLVGIQANGGLVAFPSLAAQVPNNTFGAVVVVENGA